MVLGEVYEFGSDDFSQGQDYLKVIFLMDSRTDLLYLELYPEQILGITAVPGYGVLISTKEWIYYWNTLDANTYGWKLQSTEETLVSAGNSGIIAIVSKAAGLLGLYRAFDGEKVASLLTEGMSFGKPFVSPDAVWIASSGALRKYDFELNLLSELSLPGLDSAGEIYGFNWGLLVTDRDQVFRVDF